MLPASTDPRVVTTLDRSRMLTGLQERLAPQHRHLPQDRSLFLVSIRARWIHVWSRPHVHCVKRLSELLVNEGGRLAGRPCVLSALSPQSNSTQVAGWFRLSEMIGESRDPDCHSSAIPVSELPLSGVRNGWDYHASFKGFDPRPVRGRLPRCHVYLGISAL